MQRPMRSDRSAVAGFFEDLPVLLFVLSGVVALVLTSVFVSERMAVMRFQERMDVIARDIVDSVATEILLSCGAGVMPAVSSIKAHDFAEVAVRSCGGRSYAVSVLLIHPSYESMVDLSSDMRDQPRSTGFASTLLNALDECALNAIVEVRAVVW